MSLWEGVEKRIGEEIRFVDRLKAKNVQGIEAFYPELYHSPGRCAFTNTLGSDLIPDAITSRKVLVDLYDWPDESGLIRTYGVDLGFLQAMREAKRIRLCANLPPERYEQCTWLHETLADDRTIWRSIRTPGFFAASDPTFDARRNERADSLRRYFTAHAELVPELARLTDPAHPATTATQLAEVLSHWIERLLSFEPELGTPIARDFEKNARERIPDLKRLHRLAVSPFSAALGGTMKMWRHRWSSLFGDEGIAEVSGEGLLRSRELLSYLSEVKLSLTASDLATEQTWRSMAEATRLRLLEFLQDEQETADMIAAEERIRTALAARGEQDPTREDIRAYLADVERTVRRLGGIWDGARIALPIVFGAVSENWLLAAEVGVGLVCSRRLLGDRAQHIVEGLIGKVQLVRTLGQK